MLAPQGIPAGGEANVPAWELIDSYEDTDTGTAFDYDSGVVTVYNFYKVILQLEGHGGGDTELLNIRVNADSSANYNYQYFRSGGGGTTSGTSQWGVQWWNNGTGIFVIDLRGGNLTSAPTNNQPIFHARAGKKGEDGLAAGHLAVDYADVDQVRIWTASNATGRLRLYGLNL